MPCWKYLGTRVQFPPPPFRPRAEIESRQEKVESRRIQDLENFQGERSLITTQLSPCLLGLLSTDYSLSCPLLTYRKATGFQAKSAMEPIRVGGISTIWPAKSTEHDFRRYLSNAESNGRFAKPSHTHLFGITRDSEHACLSLADLVKGANAYPLNITRKQKSARTFRQRMLLT